MTPSLLKVREALEPFAKLGADYNRSEASTARKYADEGRTYTPHSDYHRVSVAIGDLRRAAAAYESLSHLEATTPQPLDGVTVQDIVADNLILAQWLGEICQTFETLLGDIGHSAQSFERGRIEEARAVLNRLDYQSALSNPKPEE